MMKGYLLKDEGFDANCYYQFDNASPQFWKRLKKLVFDLDDGYTLYEYKAKAKEDFQAEVLSSTEGIILNVWAAFVIPDPKKWQNPPYILIHKTAYDEWLALPEIYETLSNEEKEIINALHQALLEG